MGAGQSIPQSLPSSQKYRGQVIPTQNLVNDIFLWMAQQVDTNDLIKLANPKACKDYVFLTREALTIFMKQIQLEPKMGQKNTLYFASVKDLTFADEKAAEQRPTQKLYRDSLCAQLAFFYVRIFQVFGALALTVIDSLPEANPRQVDIRQAAVAFDGKPQPPPLFAARGGAGLTRADRVNLQEFYDFASSYFVKPDIQEDFYVITEQSKGARRMFRQTDKDTIFFYPAKDNKIVYQAKNNSYLEARISITSAQIDVSYTLRIDNIIVDNDEIGYTYNIPMTHRVNDYFYPPRKNFTDVLNAIISAAIRPTLRGKTVEEILGERKDIKGEVKLDETGVPEGLSYMKIREYLREKPKAYCVARAIQLLSPTLVDGSQQGAVRYGSDVCYFDASEPYLKNAVPIYNHPITDNTPGLRALNQLFYDVLKGVTPMMSQETDIRYKEFLKIMHTIFSPKLEEKTLNKLQDVRSQPLTPCASGVGTDKPQDKKIILTTKNSIREVQKSIAELLNYQIRHTANVARFMTKLFVIDKSNKVIGIHPAILRGGMAAVNRLAEEARDRKSVV